MKADSARRACALLEATSFLFVVVGCASPPVESEFERFEPTLANVRGVWQSDGYGYVVSLGAHGARVFHVAGNVCFEEVGDGPTFLDFHDLFRRGTDGATLYLASELDKYTIRFARLASLPKPCTFPPVNTPLGNFGAFASYYTQHYGFFDLYGVNWASAIAEERSAITADTSDRELYASMTRLLDSLRDAHIGIDATLDGEDVAYNGNPGKTELAVEAMAVRQGLAPGLGESLFRRGYWFDDIRDDLLGGHGTAAGNNRIQYGMVSDRVGYVAFASMGGFVDGEYDTIADELPALDDAMDDLLELFVEKGAEAVVLDLSLNTGGYDFVARAIAQRFAKERTLAYTQRASDSSDGSEFAFHLQPSRGRRFTGPVFVLTSDLTVSAGEVLTLCMRALDNVTHVGETTRGALSTVLKKYLPNGWEIALSNEVFSDSKGTVWEGRGIDPEVDLPIFDSHNPVEGHVTAVRALLELRLQALLRQEPPAGATTGRLHQPSTSALRARTTHPTGGLPPATLRPARSNSLSVGSSPRAHRPPSRSTSYLTWSAQSSSGSRSTGASAACLTVASRVAGDQGSAALSSTRKARNGLSPMFSTECSPSGCSQSASSGESVRSRSAGVSNLNSPSAP